MQAFIRISKPLYFSLSVWYSTCISSDMYEYTPGSPFRCMYIFLWISPPISQQAPGILSLRYKNSNNHALSMHFTRAAKLQRDIYQNLFDILFPLDPSNSTVHSTLLLSHSWQKPSTVEPRTMRLIGSRKVWPIYTNVVWT